MKVGIIGTGPMALALAGALRRAEVPVRICGSGRREPARHQHQLDDLLAWSTVLVPAVPFPVALALVDGPLAGRGCGRTLVDLTNPAMGSAEPVLSHRSGGESLAAAAASWRVAKAFNAVSVAVVGQAPGRGRATTLLVATDHESARRDAFAMAQALGMQPLHAGGIDSSRHLESLAVLLRRISARHRGNGRVSIAVEADAEETPAGPGNRPRTGQPRSETAGPNGSRSAAGAATGPTAEQYAGQAAGTFGPDLLLHRRPDLPPA